MAKQKLEQYLRNTLKQMNCWFVKLQNAHFQPTPADFIVLTDTKRYLIECKQIEFNDYNSSFSFERLKQKKSLLEFKTQNTQNESLVLLMFWNKRLKYSFIYSIPILDYLTIESEMLSVNVKSLNMDYLDQFQKQFKIEVIKGKMELKL